MEIILFTFLFLRRDFKLRNLSSFEPRVYRVIRLGCRHSMGGGNHRRWGNSFRFEIQLKIILLPLDTNTRVVTFVGR